MAPRALFRSLAPAVLLSLPGGAQTTTTGMVAGEVRDPAGRALDGVRVRLTGSQVTRTLVTGADGRFQAGLLNPGGWRVSLEKPGYEARDAWVSVTTGETLPVRFRMAEAAGATVEVGTPAPWVSLDPTSTSAGLTLGSEDLARLPVGRSMNDLAYLAPGVGFAGTAWNRVAGVDYAISGASGVENQFLADGLITTDLRYGGQGLFLVPEFLDSVQVETSGFKPEAGALGGVFNAVIRSGSNTFKGEAWATLSPAAMEARAESSTAARQPAPGNRHDLGFGLGGPILKDRLFYFAGLDLDRRRENTEANLSGLRGDDKDTATRQLVLKVNGYLSPERQLAATFITTRQQERQPRAYPGGYGDADMGYGRTFETRNLSLVYDHSFGTALLLSVKAGTSWRRDETRPERASLPNIQDAHWFDGGGGGTVPELAGFNYSRGGYGSHGFEEADTRQLKVDATWILGAHAVKAGLSHLDASYSGQDFATGPAGGNWTYYIFQDGATLEASRSGRLKGTEVKARYQTFYLQDTWELGPSLRLIYGLRTQRQELRDADGAVRLRFSELGRCLQPRLGFTWDAAGDGRTLVTGNYAVYFEQMPQRLAFRAWGNETVEVRDFVLHAYSPAGLGTFDPGTPSGGWSWEPNTTLVAPGTRLPRRQEYSLGLEKALTGGWTWTAHALFRHLTDGLDDSAFYDRAGTPYALTAGGSIFTVLWNPGASVTFTAPPGSTDAQGRPIGGRSISISDTLFPQAWNRYAALTLGLGRRGPRSAWNATYTWSHLWGTYEGLAYPDRGTGVTADAHFGQGWDAWPYVGTGNLGLDRRHSLKLFGSTRFALGGSTLTVGGRWTWQSGLALSLLDDGSTSLGLPPGTLGPFNPLDPLGVGGVTPDRGLVGNRGRSPSLSVADLHLDLEFGGAGLRWRPTLDLFNVFNSRTPTTIQQGATKWWTAEPDPTFGQPSEWLQGRRVQVGLRVGF